VHAILESYGKEILESISEQFLDLAVEVRFQIISVRELVKLLTKANRLGYQETDIVDNEDGAHLVQGGNTNSQSKPDAIGTPKPPSAIAGQCRPHSTASSQPPSLEKSRTQIVRTQPKSCETSLSRQAHASMPKGLLFLGRNAGYSIQSIHSVADIQDDVSTATGTTGKQG
jgi:hypothetical protein